MKNEPRIQGIPFPTEEEPASVNARAIREQARESLADLRDFLALPAAPTPAQRLAFEKRVARILIGLIRVELGDLDGTD